MTLPPTAELVVCPPGEDPLGLALLKAEADADAAGWGSEREAVLWWWWLHDNGRLPNGTATIAMRLADVPADTAVVHPLPLIEWMLTHLPPVNRTLIGFALVQEAWILQHGGDPASEARALAVAARREVWKQPDRIEARMASLQMLTGATRNVIRIRGEAPVMVGPTRAGDPGEVPAAMARLAVALRLRKYGRRG